MEGNSIQNYIKELLENTPSEWLNLTTHRLDIYDESLAKSQFLAQFEVLFSKKNTDTSALQKLPTAYDYIRLGHPLSCVLEWSIAKLNNLKSENVISFSSQTIPVLAILRTNLLAHKKTQILYTGTLPSFFDADVLQRVYGYQFELKQIENTTAIAQFDGSTVFIAQQNELSLFELHKNCDFVIHNYGELGSVLAINGAQNNVYISDIQHVRRRETIAMTPANTLTALKRLIGHAASETKTTDYKANKILVLETIQKITGTNTTPLVGSSGLSIQYAIMMGLVHDALDTHPGKAIKIIVPPNCYGGTNDQARRVAACLENVEVVDLLVDGAHDMVQSIELVLHAIAKEDAVPFIIAEIPTNPRVEVPDLLKLKAALSATRKTESGKTAIDPVFILDQTFCPNVLFLGEDEILSAVRTISYVSGSKFPSGGKCTAGYCVGNKKTDALMEKIALHLNICDNDATALQMEFLAKQLPSMNQRIKEAYLNTRAFVSYIQKTLPEAKINFVSEALASQGFTPSVFSLDLPTKGTTDAEREEYKRRLNHQLINLMITEIPNESKYCVSYGQLNGVYWTIPATSTQGTTKEVDKDYIARVALSPNMDLALHKKVFSDFVASIS
ncbi:PLP-dependent transferase [Polaribacter sp.]|nr:PLP-dependent transferase [Polaribacter sp.]